MKLLNLNVLGLLGLSLFLVSAEVFAGSAVEEFQKLNAADQNKVQEGGQVVQFGSQKPWPSVAIYQRINATPEESAAMFFDYSNHLKFIPHVTKSVPSAVSKTVYNVEYQVKLPFIPAWMGGIESYTVRDEVTTYDNGHGYEVTWSLVPGHGETVKSSVGSARFEDLGGATLLAYTSYIVPGRSGSDWGFVIDGAKDSVKKAVTAIAKQVEKEKSSEPSLLQTQLEKLKEAFSNSGS
jgi:hypothetical protein